MLIENKGENLLDVALLHNKKIIFLFFSAIIFFVYSSTISLPYMLLDENWLLRGIDSDPAHTYPLLRKMISIIQGRPFFALLLSITRGFAHLTSQTIAIQMLRFMSILGLAAFALQIYTLSMKIKIPFFIAIAIALSSVTLPPFQVLIGNATWLVIPLLLIAWSFLICFDSAPKNYKNAKLNILVCIFLCGISLATYQSLIMINLSLLLFVFLFGYNSLSKKFYLRLALRVMLISFVALIIYCFLWDITYKLILGHFTENRYSPHSISLTGLSQNLIF